MCEILLRSGFASLLLSLGIQVLGAKSKAAIADAIQALEDSSPAVRLEAINQLGALGVEAEAALKPLLALMDSEENVDRINAAWALGKIAPSEAVVIEAQIDALESGNLPFAYNAGLSLDWAGEAALPFLKRLLDETDVSIARYYAASILSRKDETYRVRAKDVFLELLKSESAEILLAGLQGLENLAFPSPDVIEAIRKALSSENTEIRDSAAYVAVALGVSAAPLRDDLLSVALNEGSRNPRLTSITALGNLANDEVALKGLASLLGHDDRRIRAWSQNSIAKFGKSAIPYLNSALDEDDHVLRLSTLSAIALLNVEDGDLVNRLLGEYPDTDGESKFRILYCLWSVGKKREDAIAFIRSRLDSEDGEIIAAHARSIVNHIDSGGK